MSQLSCPCCAQECTGYSLFESCTSLMYCDNGDYFTIIQSNYEIEGCLDDCPENSTSALWLWVAFVCILACALCCVICNCFIEASRRRARDRLEDEIDEDEARERRQRRQLRQQRNGVIQGQVVQPEDEASFAEGLLGSEGQNNSSKQSNQTVEVGQPGDKRRASVLSIDIGDGSVNEVD